MQYGQQSSGKVTDASRWWPINRNNDQSPFGQT